MKVERLPLSQITEFVRSVLTEVNADNEQGLIFADALIWSDLIGRPTHGIWRLPFYVKRISLGLNKCPCEPKFRQENLAIDVMDGDQGIGHYVGYVAMNRAVQFAKKHGIGAVGVHNSNHFGTGSYFVHLAAEQGMIGIAVSNSISKVAPYNGIRAVFGTNPFAFGAPRQDGKSLMLDMATAAIAGAQVMKYAEQGKALPEGIAINSEGQPIFDPNQVNKGVLLPFGGAKGYGLSLMIEILSSILTGAAMSIGVNSMFTNFEKSGKNGHFFIAIDIKRFIDMPSYYGRMEELLSLVKGANGELSNRNILIPGETRWEEYERNTKEGIPLDTATVNALKELSDQYSTPALF